MTNTNKPLSIGLLGTGAIGSVMALHWASQHLFGLPRQRGQKTCVRIKTLAGDRQVLNIPPWQGQTLDWLVVTTKAADTLSALQSWQDYLPAVKRIMLLQNGMGQQQNCADWLATAGLPCELWAAVSTHGAYRTEEDHTPLVVHAGNGSTKAGLWPGDSPPADQTGSAEIPPELPPGITGLTDILRPMRIKLAINAVINPPTAVLQCPNGELVSDPRYLPQLQALAQEIDHFYHQLNWYLPEPLAQTAAMVAQTTAANRSSTYQDILAGRPTELPWISGYLLHQARQQGTELPLTADLYHQTGESGAAHTP